MVGKTTDKHKTTKEILLPHVTQRDFEGLVREVYSDVRYNQLQYGEDYIIQSAFEISRLVYVLKHHPELLENKRLRYNLGYKKSQWLDDIWQMYKDGKLGKLD